MTKAAVPRFHIVVIGLPIPNGFDHAALAIFRLFWASLTAARAIIFSKEHQQMVGIGHLIAVLAVAVSAASIAIAVYQYRRSVHRDIFRVYADKYDAILQPEIYPQWQKALAGDNTHWERLTPVMIAYLNLIWEECYLAGDRVIPKQLWELWRPEIQRVLCSDFAKQIMNTCDFHFPDELTCGSARLATELRGSQM